MSDQEAYEYNWALESKDRRKLQIVTISSIPTANKHSKYKPYMDCYRWESA